MRMVSMVTRDEVLTVLAGRYEGANRQDRGRILDELVALTGHHRKHAARVLRGGTPTARTGPRPGRRLYDDAARQALIVVWEAADRIYGKRLKQLLPTLLDAMGRHGHLDLDGTVQDRLLAMSAATMDRALADTRATAGRNRRRSTPSSAVKRLVPIRTFADWGDPAPGFAEADLVQHSGPNARGSFLYTLVVTDIATGWTECAPLLVREQVLLTRVLDEVRKTLPFPLLGFDTDNDSVFMNETVRSYCAEAGVEFTRCRPYRKNDQAWIEQKNGAVVRRTVGYRRYEGLQAASVLARLYKSMRFYVNHFQPSFKLQAKARDGAKVRKTYHKPKTPYERLIADGRTTDELRRTLETVHAGLDPVALLRDIRALQAELVTLADQPIPNGAEPPTAPSLEQFLTGLRTAWQDGEVRPTARKKQAAKRGRRRPDPLAAVTDTLRAWFEAEPFRTSRELLERLMAEHPDAFTPGQIRTVQRRLKGWRSDVAHKLVFGDGELATDLVPIEEQSTSSARTVE